MRSEMEQKRQIIKLVFQNLELKGKTVRYDYVKPFNQIFSYADRQAWLPLIDAFRNKELEFGHGLEQLKAFLECMGFNKQINTFPMTQ